MSKKYLYDLDLAQNNAPARLARMVGHGKSVLDIGCGSGSLSKVLTRTLGCVVTGIELDPDAVEDAKQHCSRVIVGDIESLSLDQCLGDEHFDVVIFGDVLEHLRNPEEVLKNVKPYLADNGYLLASIPNIVHASVILDMVRGHFDYRDYGLLDDTHLRFFTRNSALQLFASAGYTVVDLDRVIYAPTATEFATAPLNSDERRILDYIIATSLESQTYQFIVRATKWLDAGSSNMANPLALREDILELTNKLAYERSRVRALESALEWLERNWIYRLLASFRKLLHRVARP